MGVDTYTTNGFFELPGLGVKGETERQLFNAGLQRADTALGIQVGNPGFEDLPTALAAIGSTQANLRIGPNNAQDITTTITIPANVVLVDGPYPIFSCTGAGKVIITAPLDVYPEWFGATGDGSTDDTAAFVLAKNCFPSDVYGVECGTIRLSRKTYVVDTLAAWGYAFRLMGVSKLNSVLKSLSGNNVINVNGNYTHSFEIGNLKIEGNGGSGHGIYVHNMTFGYNIHDIYITSCGGKGVYDTDGFSQFYMNIDIDLCGDNAFEIHGDPGTTCFNIYVHNVASGKCGFRIDGSPTMIACNGIDSGETWGIFGRDVANDGVLKYSLPMLINCNVEAFTDTGILCRDGSDFHAQKVSFGAKSDAVNAIAIDITGGPNKIPTWTGVTIDQLAGGWKNGYPIHCKGGPPAILHNCDPIYPITKAYHDTSGATYTLPVIDSAYIAYYQWGLVLGPTTIGDRAAGNYVLVDENGAVSFNGIASLGGVAVSSAGAAPTSGTYKQGAVVFNSAAASGQPAGWTCVSTGTFSAYSTTGTTDGTTATVTAVGSTAAVSVADYITIATTGNGPFRVVSKTSNTLVVTPIPDTAGVGLAIATTDPTFKAMGNLA